MPFPCGYTLQNGISLNEGLGRKSLGPILERNCHVKSYQDGPNKLGSLWPV
jgi:hypothetical protein